MIRISGLKIKIPHTTQDLLTQIIKKAKGQVPVSFEIVRRSIDARKKPELYYVYTLDVSFSNEKKVLSIKNSPWLKPQKNHYHFPGNIVSIIKEENRPVIIGAGPAGLFAGLVLARCGLKPKIIERGDAVSKRSEKVEHFFSTGELDRDSNVQFGEGGAGTFSDGKLNTLVKDKSGRNHFVLEEFVKHGAPEDILYEAKPHIGTDILKNVVASIRDEIISLGGEVLFGTKFVGILKNQQGSHVTGIRMESKGILTEYACRHVILAIGHSARDTFFLLHQEGITMEPKSFAIGVRVEHPASMINDCMYGEGYPDCLGAANYKLTHQCANGRGIYTFCMCPGGYVINSSSEENHLCVNGMSNRAREGKNSNSAVIVTVTPDDFPGTDPLAGIAFQRKYESLAYRAARGKIPVQLFGDYVRRVPSLAYGDVRSQTKGDCALSDVRSCLPKEVGDSIEEGIRAFGRKIKGYDREDALISGVETRTSSPVRIIRNESGNSSLCGLYPCGEGAGYAGGITSAAIDGIKTAENVMKNIDAGSLKPWNHVKTRKSNKKQWPAGT